MGVSVSLVLDFGPQRDLIVNGFYIWTSVHGLLWLGMGDGTGRGSDGNGNDLDACERYDIFLIPRLT